MIGGEIGSFAFGEAEEELENVASAPVLPCIAQMYAKAWNYMFGLAGAQIVYRRNVEDADPIRINTRAFFRHLKDSEMIGDVQASDVAVLIDPTPLKAQGLSWPPDQGDMIIRRAGKSEETLFQALATPHVIDVAGVDIVVRMIARFGGA